MSDVLRSILICMVLSLPAWCLAGDRVAARVNGVPITERQVDEAVDQLVPRASFHGSMTGERLDAFREKALEGLVNVELQYQYAVASGIKPDAKHVKVRMRQVREAFQSKQDYKDWLKRIGRTEEQLRAMVEKEQMIAEARRRVVETPAMLSESQVKAYYEQNPGKFLEPAAARLRIISTREEPRAQEALDRIRGGEDFANVAANVSEDNYRIRGGDIGYVHSGRIYPELEQTAAGLAVGESSGLIHTENRWFIVKVEDRRRERRISFEEAKDKLEKDLEENRQLELAQSWIAELRAKASIEIMLRSQPTGS